MPSNHSGKHSGTLNHLRALGITCFTSLKGQVSLCPLCGDRNPWDPSESLLQGQLRNVGTPETAWDLEYVCCCFFFQHQQPNLGHELGVPKIPLYSDLKCPGLEQMPQVKDSVSRVCPHFTHQPQVLGPQATYTAVPLGHKFGGPHNLLSGSLISPEQVTKLRKVLSV